MALLAEIEATLPPAQEVTVPSRIVHLPLSWNDPDAELAMRKYQELVRPNAPWCPSNIEFIRRINGLADEQAVKHIVFDASYLVLGLGDVYLGAPVATPIDPRHRLVTTKYNPARTWTPENAVGIGGAYMCIYGMEGPGGYQLFGRTIQVWNTWRQTPAFAKASPGCSTSSTRSASSPSATTELTEARAAFPHGGYPVRIEETEFSYAAYERRTAGATRRRSPRSRPRSRPPSTPSASAGRKPASTASSATKVRGESLDGDIPAGCFGVASAVPGNIWKMLVEPGAPVAAGETVAIIESMKMEINVTAHAAGRVRELRAGPGRNVKAGDIIVVLEEC